MKYTSSLIVVVFGTLQSAWAQPATPIEKTERLNAERTAALEQMRSLINALKIVPRGSDGQEPQPLISQPLFRHNSPTRRYNQGTTWAWGSNGRPVAFVKLFTGDPERIHWTYCCALTSSQPVEMYRGDEKVWFPDKSDMRFRSFPDSRVPSDDPSLRLRQMKQLAHGFSGHEFWHDARHELTLKIQPVHRYSDPDQGILDWIVFFMAHEVEPEIVLLIEAIEDDMGSFYQYGAIGIGGAEFHVELDGTNVYSRAQAGPRGAGLATESFFGFVRPETVSR